MPDFDKNLNPILLNKETELPVIPVGSTPAPSGRMYGASSGGNGGGSEKDPLDKFFGAGPVVSPMLPTVSAKDLYNNRRYAVYNPETVDIEDQKAYAQSTWDKATNGILKGLNLTATTVAGGFGFLYGAAKSPFTGRLADIWDNEVMRGLDEWNNNVDQNLLPNYYTNVEKNAAWYSPDNWFTANFLFDKLIKNTGYAVGAMISGNIFNAGLLRAGAAIGRGASALATASETSQAFKLFTPLLKNTARAFSAAKNIEAAAVLEKEISSIADVTARSSKLAELAKSTNAFSEFGLAARRTAIAAYSSAGEASFEALQTATSFRNSLIDEYKNSHNGAEPSGQTLQDINDYADRVGKTSFFGNLAILSVTEYAQLPKLLGSSYAAERQAANSLMGKANNVLLREGKYVAAEPLSKFGKLYNKIEGVGKYFFDPKEAAQEGLQYALQIGTQNYFNKAYQSNAADVWTDGFLYGFTGKDKSGETVGLLGSKEGMESMLLGGITGGMMQFRGNIAEKRATESNTQKFINQLNQTPSFQQAFKDRLASVNRSVVLQEQQQDAVMQGDKLEAKDLQSDMMHNYLSTRIKYGRFDMVMDDINDLREMSSTEKGLGLLKEQGIANMNDTLQSYQQRLMTFENTAKNLNEIYKAYDLRYSGEVLKDEKGNPILDSNGNQLRKYSPQVIDKMIYASYKVADYDLRIPQVNESLAKNNIFTQDVIDSIIKDGKPKEEATKKAIDQINDLNVVDYVKEELKSSLSDVVEMSLRRKLFLDEYNDILKNPNKFEEKDLSKVDESKTSPENTITVKAKDGKETTLDVGEEYVAGSKEIKTEQGVTLDKFLRFKVVGKAENGNIIIQTENGEQHNLKPSAFEEYNFGKYKDLNLNSKFYLDNYDKIFNFRFKGGKETQGKLVFDKKTKSLYFESVDKRKNGEPLYKIPVTRDQFVAREGYKKAQIWSDSKFSLESEKLLSEPETAEEKDIKANFESKLAERRRIITQLADRTKTSLERVSEKIVSKKEQLEKINKEIEELAEFRQKDKYSNKSIVTNFNKVLSRSMKGLSQLTSLKQSLENEIADLEDYKSELESDIAYFEDFIQNLQELPQDFREMINDLKEQVGNLENLSISAGTQINQFSKLIDSVNAAIKDLMSLLKSSFQKFDKDYPDYIKNSFNEMMENPLYEKVKELKEYIADYALLQDVQKEISVNEDQVKDLAQKIKDLYKEIDEIEKEQRAKEKILNAFEDALKKYETQKAEEARILKNSELFKKFIGTMSTEVQNPIGEDGRKYQPESKKSDFDVVGGTLAVEDGKAHQARANRFGERFHTLDNKDEIRGVIVTLNTEDQILPGLVEQLTGYSEKVETSKDTPSKIVEEMKKKKEMAKTVIALVMVNESGELVDEFGQPIPQGAKLVDSAIYQVFPTEKLEQFYKKNGKVETMFRDSTPDEVKESLREQYKAWREARLSETQLPVPQGVTTSFGFPEYVKKLNENGKETTDYSARNSVESTGMATAASLKEDPLVMVNTTNEEVSNGSVTFKAPKGRVFLKVPGGLIKLFNNRFSAAKAKTLYDVILQVSKNAYNQLDEKLSNEEKAALEDKNNTLFSWLRSVLYWGIAKDMQTGQRKEAGYNNVWFEEVLDEEGNKVTKLFISGKGEGFLFSPSEVEAHKEDIISLLQNLYHNVSASMVNGEKTDWKQPYYEITGIDKNGNPITTKWENYQTYLLSSKGRSEEDIPLTTPIQKLSEAKPSNRSGIYFTLTSTPDDFVIPTVSPKAPTATAPTVQTTPQKAIVNDGTTVNSITHRTLGELKFTIDKEGNVKFPADSNGDFDASVKKAAQIAADTKGYPALPTEETVKAGQATGLDLVYAVVKRDATKLLEEQAKQPAATQQAPTAPVVTQPALVVNTQTAFDLKGGVNTIVSPSVGNIRFTADEQGNVQILEDDDVNKPIETFMKLKGYDRNKAISVMTEHVKTQIAPQVVAKTIPDAPPLEEFTEEDDDEWDNRPRNTGRDDKAYRLQIVEAINKFEGENWKKVEEFLKKNFPNVPVYRVKNIIKATNGRQAWGMFKNGAIYLYENAEVGTAYHEVFEAVWKMFTDANERNSVTKEFRARKGSYIDRETQTEVAYKDATDAQIKEQLAEEFRDYVMTGKIPAKPTEGKPFIIKLFMDLVNFIKEFFTGNKAQVNTANLFSKIGNGYYAKYIPYETNLSYAKAGIIDIADAIGTSQDEFRIATIPSTQVHEIIQHMTYSTLTELTKNNKNLFEIGKVGKIGKAQLYERLFNEVRDLIGYQGTLIEQAINNKEITAEASALDYNSLKQLYKSVKKEWSDIIQKHEEYLKTYNIEFDENDNIAYHEESGKSDYQDARKIDAFRKANAAIKILFATVPMTEMSKDKGRIVKRSSVGGVITLPMDRVYITLKNKLHDALTLDDMLERVRKFSLENPDYQALYERLTKSKPLTKNIDWKKIENTYDMHLLGAFWKSMKSQDADKKTVFILPGNEIVIGDSSLASAAGSNKFQMFNSFVSTIRNGLSQYVKYDSKEKKYNATTEIDKVNLTAKDLSSYTTFLDSFGINFTPAQLRRKLSDAQLTQFKEAVQGIRDSIARYKDIASLNRQSLGIDGRIMKLGVIKAILENPEFESTYFNINGERVQTYIGTNHGSDLHDAVSKVKNISDLASGQYAYLVPGGDVNSEGSVVLGAMFNITGENTTGKRIAGTEDLLHVGYVDGIVDETTGKKKESSSVTIRERLIQELNLNLQGYYMNLVPGDAAIEWMTNMGNHVTKAMLDLGYDDVLNIFKNYFMAEVKLSRDNRKIVGIGDRKTTDLRFFKAILGKSEHDSIVKYIQANKNKSAEEVYNENKKAIDNAVKEFIKDQAEDTKELLKQFDILKYEEGQLVLDKIDIPSEDMNEVGIDKNIELMAINYIIANVEFHKLLFSDPYQYKDELKRVKNFYSPRQPLMIASSDVRNAINRVYNKGYDVTDKIGYTDMTRNFFRSTTIADVISKNDLKGYTDFEETDGGGYISMKANRLYRISAGEWNDNEEMQYRYDVAYEKSVKGLQLNPEEKKFLGKDGKIDAKKNPNVRSAYTPIKPIVSGNKADGKNYNDIVLDKFALVPLSFRALHELNPESNALKFYEKMQKEDVDYGVYGSGRKVGAGKKTAIYNEDGSFNSTPFAEINNIPFEIVGTQAEVPSKDTPKVRQATQITKLVTMDFMEAGVPIDFEPGGDLNARFSKWIALSEEQKMKSVIYKEIKNNQRLLEERLDEGFKVLIDKLGISKTEEGFKITDRDKLIDTLKNEILKREVNENITDAFEGFKSGDVVVEATPAYQQIRNILYSIADSNVISPKITGGMKVQIPSTMLESVRPTGKDGVFQSDVLNFYSKTEDGKKVNVCEIMVARWFQSDKTDEELIKYFNEDPEGQKQLAAIFGVAFRIPTQKQNSIDAFKIKKFLPSAMGDSVVIPSALVKKAGSDFDIDKLSIYLKNVYEDGRGNIKLIPFLGYGQQAKDELGKMYDDGEFLTKEEMKELDRIIEEEKDPLFSKVYDEEGNLIDTPENKLFRSIFSQAFTDEEITKDFVKSLTKDNAKQKFIDGLYRKSLENAYIQSLENLITHPENFDKLTTPNSADVLKDLAKEIVEKTGGQEFDYGSVGSMLSRRFMSSLRQAFISGKYAIGIAAVAQTNHAQNQRANIFVDPTALTALPISEADKKFLRDASIKFEKYNKVNIPGKGQVASLSMAQTQDKNYISDINSQFIDGYVDISKGPWIMQLGAKPNVAGTWLFLNKIGVPIKTIGYFMNQPIIKQYLQNLENAGYTWLFNDNASTFVDRQYEETPIHPEEFEKMLSAFKIPDNKALGDMLGKGIGELNSEQKLAQRFILQEFLKYAKMAEHLFVVTQGSNFDTANINDPILLFKKQKQLEKARTKTIISSVDEKGNTISGVDAILKSSFIGKLSEVMGDIRNAYSQILISDRVSDNPVQVSTRDVMEAVLTPHVDLNDRDFIKVAQKATADMFDWAVQTNTGLNKEISTILLGKEGQVSAAQEIMTFADKVRKDSTHPLNKNIIIQSITKLSSEKENTPDNLQILGNTKVYDQNQIIYGFNEMKKYLANTGDIAMYDKLVKLAVLQSGLPNSPISFTSLIPYADFKEKYNETLSVLDKMPNLADFYRLNVFERNNWNNTDVVDFKKAGYMKLKNPFVDYTTGFERNFIYAREMEFVPKSLKNAMNRNEIPRTIVFSPFTKEGRSEFIVYSWEDRISREKKAEMRRKGDYSFLHKGLFKKVYDTEGKPLKHVNEKGYESYIYKMVNAWGSSYRANEFYNGENVTDRSSTIAQPSIIDNGFEKVVAQQQKTLPGTFTTIPRITGEVEDGVIEKILIGTAPIVKATPAAQPTVQGTKVEVSKSNYTKETPNDKSKGFFFTENLQAYLANRNRLSEEKSLPQIPVTLNVTANNNQAGIRTTATGARNENAFAIISKKYQQKVSKGSFVKEEGQFQDIDSDFELFKKYNTEAINEALAYGKPLVISAGGIATGKSALPLRFAQWLNNELKTKLGIQGEIKENRTEGYKGYGIFNLSLQAPTTEAKSRLEELEAKKKTTGLSPAEIAEMNTLRTQFGKQAKKDNNC